jgi:tetratricopeptide (TPR) repeat protein
MSSTAEDLLKKAQKLTEEKKYEDVMELLKDELLLIYKDAALYSKKAGAFWHLKQYESSVHLLKKAIELDPDDGGFYNNLGLVYSGQKRYKDAIECYEKCKEIRGEDALLLNNLGNAYVQIGESNKAIKYFKKALALDPLYAYSYNGLGNSYNNLKQYNNAIASYEKSMELDPTNPNPLNGLGIVYSDKKQYSQAIKYYKKAIALDRSYDIPYHNLGFAYYNKGNYVEAVNCYDKAIALNDKYFKAYYKRASAYEKLEEYEKALDDYKICTTLSDNSSDYFTTIAKEKIEELSKLIRNPIYTSISEIITRIKNTLLYEKPLVTHYTSFSTAKALIINKSKFRISEGTYLNDTSEGKELFDFLPPIFTDDSKNKDTQAKPFAAKPFIGSFVTDNKHDHLALWRMYGKEENIEAKGCAITLERENFIGNLKLSLVPDDKDGLSNNISEEFNFYRITYYTLKAERQFIIPGAEDKEEAFNKDMRDLFIKTQQYLGKYSELKDKKDLLEILNSVAYLFKSAEYQYEHELRLIVKGTGMEKILCEQIPLKVYIDLVEINPLIKKITLGPKIERGDEGAALFYYALDKDGYNPEICISRLPFK